MPTVNTGCSTPSTISAPAALVKSLPVLLSQAGYRTCSIGKVHVQPDELYRFEAYANEGIAGGRNAVRMAENAEHLFAKRPAALLHLFLPDRPAPGRAKALPTRRNYAGVTPERFDPQDVPVPHFLPDNADSRASWRSSTSRSNRLDQGVGRLVQALKEDRPLRGHAGVVPQRQRHSVPDAKTNLYDSGTRLPLIIRRPIKSGAALSPGPWQLGRSRADHSGVHRRRGPDYPLHGRSLLPMLEEFADSRGRVGREFRLAHVPRGDDVLPDADDPHAEAPLHSQPGTPCRFRSRRTLRLADVARRAQTRRHAVRQPDGRGIIHRPRHELYDLEADPQEMVNLADDPVHAPCWKSYAQLKDWRRDGAGDPWLVEYERE